MLGGCNNDSWMGPSDSRIDASLCTCVEPGEPDRIARSRQGETPSSIRVPKGKTRLLRGHLGQASQSTTSERENDHKLTQWAKLRLLDMSVLSALRRQFVGGSMVCGTRFAVSGIEEQRGGLRVSFRIVLDQMAIGWYVSRYQ